MPLLDVRNLRVSFHLRDGIARAVDGVSFCVNKGEMIGIVGESGCGKSVTFYSILGLLAMPPAKVEQGEALFNGVDLLRLDPGALRKIRGRRISMIFQDPMSALNPYMSIGRQLTEPLLVHGMCDGVEAKCRATAMLAATGIQDAKERMRLYPHMFSGGMRQRVMIAMALVSQPDLLIADEPTTALDVTVQAQILALIGRLRREMAMSVVLITHDLGVVSGLCERILIMYAGRILEAAPAEDLFRHPDHPYTRALMDSIPGAHTAGKALRAIPGMPPEYSAPEQGCPFVSRCPAAINACYLAQCELREARFPGRYTACIRAQDGSWPEDVS